MGHLQLRQHSSHLLALPCAYGAAACQRRHGGDRSDRPARLQSSGAPAGRKIIELGPQRSGTLEAATSALPHLRPLTELCRPCTADSCTLSKPLLLPSNSSCTTPRVAKNSCSDQCRQGCLLGRLKAEVYLKGRGADQIQGLQQAEILLPNGAQGVVPTGNNGYWMPALPAARRSTSAAFMKNMCSGVPEHTQQRELGACTAARNVQFACGSTALREVTRSWLPE